MWSQNSVIFILKHMIRWYLDGIYHLQQVLCQNTYGFGLHFFKRSLKKLLSTSLLMPSELTFLPSCANNRAFHTNAFVWSSAEHRFCYQTMWKYVIKAFHPFKCLQNKVLINRIHSGLWYLEKWLTTCLPEIIWKESTLPHFSSFW